MEEDKAKYFQKSLEQNPDNSYSLNATGYELNKKGEFQEAILLFNKAIEVQTDFAYAYNNRGHAKIENGQLDEGLKDNLGIYHLKRNESSKALKYFLQSKQIDKDTDLIEELIKQAKALV